MRFPRTATWLLISDHGLVDMLSGNPYDRVEFRRKLQGETLMSEGIEPVYPDEYLSTASRYTHRDSSPPVNFATTLKINGPDLSFFTSHVWRGAACSGAFVYRSQRS
jgi:hypothetical protein